MTDDLTQNQRRIVESGDGPSVVIAGAGTGKTLVIVERVRYLLDHHPDLQPESVIVLTYNVKTAQELRHRLDETVGPSIRSLLTVSNFHSFCQQVLTESAADAGLPARPDVLDGFAQPPLTKDLAPRLPLVYHAYSAAI
jgi:superfamily I DNA/RNA helicase